VSPLHLAVTLTPNPVQPGQRLTVDGAGCKANGRPLGRVVTAIFRGSDSTLVQTNQSPNADGTWHTTLDVPSTYPSGPTQLSVQCDDTEQQKVGWGRFLTTTAYVGEGPPPTTIPARRPRILARTGFAAREFGFVGLALLLGGTALRRRSFRRR
jgi:hypothetical protein